MAFKFGVHFKLIQHQCKILTMIATSKYIRYKMKIETSHEGSHCLANNIETLKHIYMECPRTQKFYKMVVNFIMINLDNDFNGGKLYQFTCCHENIAISYLYLIAKC